MNETENSVRNFFFLAGALAVLSFLLSLPVIMEASNAPAAWRVSVWLDVLIDAGLGAGCFASALRLSRDLRNGTTWIRNFLLASILALLADAILTYFLVSEDIAANKAAGLLWRLPITGYLLVQLRRLSITLRLPPSFVS